MEGFDGRCGQDGIDAPRERRAEQPDIVGERRDDAEDERPRLIADLKADEATAAIPVILLSAKAQVADIRAGLDAGADDYVTKPFDPSTSSSASSKVLEAERDRERERSPAAPPAGHRRGRRRRRPERRRLRSVDLAARATARRCSSTTRPTCGPAAARRSAAFGDGRRLRHQGLPVPGHGPPRPRGGHAPRRRHRRRAARRPGRRRARRAAGAARQQQVRRRAAPRARGRRRPHRRRQLRRARPPRARCTPRRPPSRRCCCGSRPASRPTPTSTC